MKLVSVYAYQLRQLREVFRSLTFNAALMLIHFFVVSRLDYCSALCVGFPRLGLGAWFGSYARRHAILVASQDSAMLLTICGMSCIGFLSHSGSLTGSLPWSGADVVSVYLQEHHPQHPAPWFSSLF